MIEQVDSEALLDSQKGLVVICILAIIAATGYFFYSTIDKTLRFFYCKRNFLVLIMTSGDLFSALFSQVVYAKVYFETSYRPSCSTLMSAQTYSTQFFPFVYNISLVVLCAEMVFRQRISAFFRSRELGSIVMAGTPWVVGLVLILPLTMAGLDWTKCRYEDDSMTKDRARAMYWVPIVAPCVAAVGCCIAVKLIKFNIAPEGGFPGVPAQSQALGNAPYSQFQNSPNGQSNANPMQSNVETHHGDPSQPQPFTSVPQLGMNQPAASSQPNAAGTQPDGSVVTMNQLEASVEREKKINLIVAVVTFAMTMPWALFMLGYVLNDDRDAMDPVPYTVLSQLFSWTLILRSAVTPVIWAQGLKCNP